MAYLFEKHFITIFLIVGFSMYLWRQRRTGEKEFRIHWMTVVSTIILIVADCFVVWAQEDPERRLWRLIFIVTGYAARPVAALSITLIVYPKEHKPRYLQIPFFLNLLVYCTAFFSPVAVSINENYQVVFGPLGYTVYSVCFFYIIYSVLTTWDRFKHEDHGRERFILYVCALACVIAALIDGDSDGDHVNAAIVASSIFLYMFLRFFDANRDPLTRLLNRMVFYEDCDRYSTAISAVASVDMNGLKKLNDAKGHEAGDAYIVNCCKVLCKSFRNSPVYRIGGDEFAILLTGEDYDNKDELLSDVHRRMVEIAKQDPPPEERVWIACGIGIYERGKDDKVSDVFARADSAMYDDKVKIKEKGYEISNKI